jgi:putative DNA primase/helicase
MMRSLIETSAKAPAALASALAIAKFGIPVFPVHGVRDGACTCRMDHTESPKSIGKHPALGMTFNTATTDPDVIERWFKQCPYLNYGVATGIEINGSGKMLVVVDVDSYKDGADDSLSLLENVHGKLPDTAEVLTGGGGRHLYFLATAGSKFSSKLGQEGIDVKGIGGYVIGPGSRHRSGDLYDWEGSSNPTEGQELADLPNWVYEKFGKRSSHELAVSKAQASPISPAEWMAIERNLALIPADGRSTWLEVLMALKNRSDSAAMFAVADQWSSNSASYQGTDDVRKTWESLSADGGITHKTLDRLAAPLRLNGVDPAKLIANEAVKASEWPEIEPINTVPVSAPYPIEALPPVMREAVQEVQSFTRAPMALVGSAALSAMSLAFQALYNVKRDEDLTGPVSLFLLGIAESGERKSTLDTHFLQPIRDFEVKCSDDAKPAIKQYNTDMQAWEAKNRGILHKIEMAARGDGKSDDNLRRLLDAHHAAKPQPPAIPRLLWGDTTPEALTRGLATEWPSGGVVSSEGGAVLGGHGMKSENQMGNLATINELWDGKPIRIDRRTSESFTVKNARLTVAVQVQPATFDAFMKKSGLLARGTGYLARFLLAYPESTQGTRRYQRAPEAWPKRDKFRARLAEVLAVEPVIEDGALQPTMLCLSDEAMDAWIDFYNEVEGQLGKGGNLRNIRDVASKIADNAVRIAALFHVLENGHGMITPKQIAGAACLARWHLQESQRLLTAANVTTEQSSAEMLLDWMVAHLRETGGNEVASKYVLQFGPNPLRTADARDKAVDELVRRGYVRVSQAKGKTITLNPKLLA